MKNYVLSENDLVLDNVGREYILKLKDMPTEEKPREKLMLLGPASLSVAELLAILLGMGTKKEDVLSMTKRILKEYGEKTVINETNPKAIAQSLDIPIVKACQIVACFELGRRFFEKRGGRPVFVRTSKQAYQYLKEMGSFKKEHLRGLYLNSRYQVIHEEAISIGSLTANLVHPREVFRPALEYSAVAVILAHNHPSGSTKPTFTDLETTRQLIEGGRVLGIELLDHLIITKNKFLSILDQGPDNHFWDQFQQSIF